MSEPSIEKIVYFVRHGQSDDNASPVFQSPDSPLSEKGRMQAERVAERVARLSFQSLVVSPFRRAQETAEAITRMTGMQPDYSDLFVERIKPTSINGKPHTDAVATQTWREWNESLFRSGLRVEDGENFDDIVARADKALAYLFARSERSIVVVTHGFFLRALVARVLLGDLMSGETLKRVQQMAATENTGLTVLRYRGAFEEEPNWRLWIYNDHSHLG